MAKKKTNVKSSAPHKRPPVVVIMGHIDHGKSTLLDYIRKSNVVAGEAGGITQHLSAYIVEHTTSEGAKESITFLDTPGHAAFQQMRHRGADVADVAILIVSAEDGVKPQTLEALECIKAADIPYIVAINKIDLPNADIQRTKNSLIENEIYIEGMGGDISWVGISAKSGEGIPELLDLVVLNADLAELITDPSQPATGTVIEGNMDSRRGNTATLLIKDGTVSSGMVIVSGTTCAPVRIMEDFTGTTIKTASASMPIRIVGFNEIPTVGDTFSAVANKKEAEAIITEAKDQPEDHSQPVRTDTPLIPILIKADVLGTVDAIQHELESYNSDRVTVRVIGTGVGAVTANDVQSVSATENAIIVGFNVKVESAAEDLAERLGVEIDTFSIIYELSEWLGKALKERTPKQSEDKETGKVKVLKHFSTQKNTHVLGGRVEEGSLKVQQPVIMTRRDIEIGRGVIKNIQQAKSDVKEVLEGEFGMQLESKVEPAAGDILIPFDTIVT